MKYITTINGVKFEIDIQSNGKLLVNGEPRDVDFLPFEDSALHSVIMDNMSYEVLVEERDKNMYEVLMGGRLYTAEVLDERAQLMALRNTGFAADTGEISVRSPMPGLVLEVPVTEGQEVTAGQTIIILESMKMQNELKAPRAGVVQRISVQAGQSVEQNKPLITIV